MSQLAECQRAFAEGMIKGKTGAAAAMLAQDSSALRSLALYRRLIRHNYIEVLRVTYPTLARFVGEHVFDVLARGYLNRYPSVSGDLFSYGRHLPLLLYELKATSLVIALARLEWSYHEIHQAQDSLPLSPDQLQAVASADPSCVTIQVCPAIRILRFPFPVHRIWQALQPGSSEDEEINLPFPNEETVVLVSRGKGKVQVARMDLLDGRLLEIMTEGTTLAEVERVAIEAHPEFDFQRFWTTLLNLRVISGCSVKEAL